MFVVRLVVYTKLWGRKRTILLSLTLLIIHDYDALRAVLLYHLLIIGCWSVIAGFLHYRSLLTDHGRRMTVSLFVLFWVRGWSRDLVAAGEEGWTFDQSGRKLLLPNFLAERGRTNSGSSWRSVGTRQVTLYSLVVLLLRPSLHTRQCPSHILHQHPPQQHLPLYIPAATHSRPCFLQSSFVIIIRTRETQPLKLAPCATTFLLFQAAFSSLFLHFCIHPSLSFCC